MTTPRVSVLIPVYNAERYLSSAIESVLCQSYTDLEIIAIDDGSTDLSATILKEFAARDPRVIVISQRNAGISAALNRGLELASGIYIARMDSDDLMASERIAVQVKFLDENPDVGFCSSSISLIDENGSVFDTYRPEPVSRASLSEMMNAREAITYTHPTVTFRTAVGRSVGGYRSEFEPCEDMDFFGRFLTAGHAGLVMPELLLNYRVHSGSISGSKTARQIETTELVRINFYRRLEGRSEYGASDFHQVVRAMPFRDRIFYKLRMRSRILRQMAKYDRSSGRWPQALVRLGFAALLQPHKVVTQGLHALRRAR